MEIFNKYCRKRNQGYSPGEYLIIKIINRCVAPKAGYALDDWYQETILPRLMGVPAKALSGQNFWNNTRYLDETAIENIENDLIKVFIETYKEFSKVCNKLTLVFDKGNNQSDTIKEFDKEKILFVGALKPSENKELLTIPLEKFTELTVSGKKQYLGTGSYPVFFIR